MDFTISFLQLFFQILQIAGPIVVLLVSLIIVLGQVAGRVEKLPPLTALYWSFITATTVGYGDVRPASRFGRILAVIIALFGLILFGVVAAIAVQATTWAVELHADLGELKAITKPDS